MISVNGKLISQDRFPDGTPLLKVDASLLVSDDNKAVEIEWLFDDMSELFNLMCIHDKLKPYASKMVLKLPYIPNARMDRVKNPEDVFTLKTLCNAINMMKFDSIMVENAHSNVSMALLDNVTDCVWNTLGKFFDAYIPYTVTTIMFPDEGACKRYSDFARIKESYNIVVGNKHRDWKTGNILGLTVDGNADDVKDKDICIIDDVCSRGGTYKFAALQLKSMGAKNIYLFVSHLENVVDIPALREAGVCGIFTTKSIWRGDDKFVTVIGE